MSWIFCSHTDSLGREVPSGASSSLTSQLPRYDALLSPPPGPFALYSSLGGQWKTGTLLHSGMEKQYLSPMTHRWVGCADGNGEPTEYEGWFGNYSQRTENYSQRTTERDNLCSQGQRRRHLRGVQCKCKSFNFTQGNREIHGISALSEYKQLTSNVLELKLRLDSSSKS